ncbi:DUF968 domain-containing protein [Klebsiella pneumoniae]|uniref:DUF968 domain-containing protein n=3 Tax=Klebsiella pneumoniae TaxID=573 RepID=UPI0025A10B0F|nr:DUF968 domain-containing protein [Klebsiella pneumoniae]MDM7103513.1 DUF968 domain-containing protein [Klebsiella pneumoniae]MDM7107641.1 DUF968 domain-containing protein [Klebsiella pneumoniae]MDM7117519.1 DUF968 domain-containing protein [Klebsiella pneumoniae]MDM7125537.1 DUF968 domain-containing protein [Klebsiella pneumoniae]MDM7136262.1 DUF968 domain-containing protein [Klebsiella pneumoniae]
MKAVITPFVQKELGLASFKADSEVANLINSGRKFMMEPIPRELVDHMDDGVIRTEQSMATNESLRPFFSSEKVFNRIGGIESLKAYLRQRVTCCQALDRSWCDNKLTYTERKHSAVVLCWHHDNHHMMRGFAELEETLYRNRVDWILDKARCEMGLPDSRDLSMQELCWWAFMRGMVDELPEEACRIAINKRESEQEQSGPTKEADIKPYDDRAIAYVRLMEEKAAPMRAKVCPVEVDPDPGMAYFKKPKLQPLKLPNYLEFVASRPCCGCGAAGGDAQISPYLVLNRRLCAHDTYAVPLCQQCQTEIARDRNGWENEHGKLAILQRIFFDYAQGIGAITGHTSNIK